MKPTHIKHHLARLIRTTCYSIEGIKAVWQKELSFRQEVYACLVLLPFIIILQIHPIVKLILLLLQLQLLIVEMINTAIEKTIDRISLDIHKDSKFIKDLGSAAVMLTILMNVVAWIYALLFSGVH